MKEKEPIVEYHNNTYGKKDELMIWLDDKHTIQITLPLGHCASDYSIRHGFGNGWKELDIKEK